MTDEEWLRCRDQMTDQELVDDMLTVADRLNAELRAAAEAGRQVLVKLNHELGYPVVTLTELT